MEEKYKELVDKYVELSERYFNLSERYCKLMDEKHSPPPIYQPNYTYGPVTCNK